MKVLIACEESQTVCKAFRAKGHEAYSADIQDCSGGHPEYEATGGYLKTVDFKTACKMMWDKLSDNEKSAVMQLPNFNADVFEEITGISMERNVENDD